MKTTYYVAAAALALMAGTAQAADVVNGSFETPDSTTSPNYNTGGPTIFTGGAGIEANGGAFGYAAAPDGDQIAFLQNGGTATLSLVDLILGRSYSISLLSAARPNFATLDVSVAFDGAIIGAFTPTSTSFTATGPFQFVANGTSGSLSFIGGVGAGDLNAAIDNVTLSAVPEPATWAMMILGMGMVGAGLRSRRKNVTTSVRFA